MYIYIYIHIHIYTYIYIIYIYIVVVMNVQVMYIYIYIAYTYTCIHTCTYIGKPKQALCHLFKGVMYAHVFYIIFQSQNLRKTVQILQTLRSRHSWRPSGESAKRDYNPKDQIRLKITLWLYQPHSVNFTIMSKILSRLSLGPYVLRPGADASGPEADDAEGHAQCYYEYYHLL